MVEEATTLIMHSGSARSYAMEAIAAAKQSKFDEAQKLMSECESAITEAHKMQTGLIQAEVRGELKEVTLMMVHAQDHIMSTLVVKDLAFEFIDLYKKLK